jgi:hypothetical protein
MLKDEYHKNKVAVGIKYSNNRNNFSNEIANLRQLLLQKAMVKYSPNFSPTTIIG